MKTGKSKLFDYYYIFGKLFCFHASIIKKKKSLKAAFTILQNKTLYMWIKPSQTLQSMLHECIFPKIEWTSFLWSLRKKWADKGWPYFFMFFVNILSILFTFIFWDMTHFVGRSSDYRPIIWHSNSTS